MGAMDCVLPNKMTPTESTEVFPSDPYTNSGSIRDLESQSNSKTVEKTPSVWWHVLIDVPLFGLVITIIGLYELAVIPSHKAGFTCHDPKLNYPFYGDTVSVTALVGPVLLMPIAFFLATELLLFDSVNAGRSRVSEAVRRTGQLYRSYGYALCLNVIMVEMMKGATGMPRPIFFTLCEPDTGVNCTTGEYIDTFKCTSSHNWWTQYDSYHSFPSGHAAFSVYCGLFIAWYLQRRAFSWSGRTVLLVPFLQLTCACYAALCSLSRISDHRHHWWDVTVGVIIGIVTLLFAVFCLSDNFSAFRKKSDTSTT